MIERVAIVLVLVLAVIVVARVIGRWQRPGHPPIDLGDFGSERLALEGYNRTRRVGGPAECGTHIRR